MNRRHALQLLGAAAVGGVALSARQAEAVVTGLYAGTYLIAADSAPSAVKDVANVVAPGGTDHTVVNAALQARSHVTTWGDLEGGQIRLPSGTSWVGMGRAASSYKLADGTDSAGIVNDVVGATDLTLQGISFDFNGWNQASDTHGFRGEGVTGLWIDGCDFRGAPHHNVTAHAPPTGVNSGWYISNCRGYSPGQRPLDPNGRRDADNFRIENGFDVDFPGGTLLSCEAYDATHHNFHLGPRVEAIGCQAERGQNANYNVKGSGAAVLGSYSGVHGQPGIQAKVAPIMVTTAAPDARVQNNTILESDTNKDAITSEPDHVLIQGNRIHSAARDGVRVRGDFSDVTGNVITNYGGQQVNDQGTGNRIDNL